jgi:hypothetical protein
VALEFPCPSMRHRDRRAMLGCPGVHGHLLANHLFEASLCRPTAPGLPIWGPETSVRHRFSCSSRTSRCLPVNKYLGCGDVKHNGGSRYYCRRRSVSLVLASSPACEARSRGLRGHWIASARQRHRGVVGVCGTGIQSPRTEDPRCYLVKQLHGRAEDVDTKRIPADPIRDHVPGTVSPARQGGLFG